MDVRHLGFEFGGLHAAVVIEQALAEGIEGDTTVHGTCVDIDIAHLAGQILGHRALTARAVAIDCNRYLFHNAYDIFINSDDVVTWYLP